MNKLTLIPLISALSCSSLVHAGGMGEQSGLLGTSGFASLEGGYAVTSIDNFIFTVTGPGGGSISSTITKQHYAIRLAGGLINMIDDQFAVTSELGWGYYGKDTLNPSGSDFGSLIIEHTITGFDALVGIAYIQPNYSLSLKAGAMIQNMTTKTTASGEVAGLFSTGFSSLVTKVNQTAALPEIKLGGSYNFDNNWSLTAAYLVALGSANKISASFDPGTGTGTLVSDSLNPTMNALLLGIQFTC